MTIIFFIISLSVLFGMVGSKVVEIKFQKTHFLSDVFVQGDERIHRFLELAVSKYNRYKTIAGIFIFEFLPSYAYELLVRMKDFVSKKYYSAGNQFSGKKILRGNGSVSFLLERLSEDKSNTKGHKV